MSVDVSREANDGDRSYPPDEQVLRAFLSGSLPRFDEDAEQYGVVSVRDNPTHEEGARDVAPITSRGQVRNSIVCLSSVQVIYHHAAAPNAAPCEGSAAPMANVPIRAVRIVKNAAVLVQNAVLACCRVTLTPFGKVSVAGWLRWPPFTVSCRAGAPATEVMLVAEGAPLGPDRGVAVGRDARHPAGEVIVFGLLRHHEFPSRNPYYITARKELVEAVIQYTANKLTPGDTPQRLKNAITSAYSYGALSQEDAIRLIHENGLVWA